MDSIQIKPDVKSDPTPAPAANIVETATGVQVQLPTDAAPANTPERPTWLPEKFKSVEDMAKAYAELETKLGQPKPDEAPAATQKPTEKPAAETPAPDKPAETPAVDQAALTGAVAEAVGGAAQIAPVLEWAKTGLEPAVAAAYNAAVDSGNPALVKLAAAQVMAAYTAANGSAPTLVKVGEVVKSGDVQPFASNAQVVEAMRDKRYAKDPAYRAQVEKRVMASSF